MIPESPNDAQAKVLLDAMEPQAIGTIMRLRAMQNATAGFVTWDATPGGESFIKHRETLADAFHAALAFCTTDTRSEWVVLGATVFVYTRGLKDFQQRYPPVECEPLLWVGMLRSISVYVPSVHASLRIPIVADREVILCPNEFYAGVSDRCARGLVRNNSIAVNEQRGRICW